MGNNSWTTQDLINDIILYSHMPISSDTFSVSQILKLAQYELQTPITKQILASRGGYYMTYQDYAIASDGLYSIPSDAVAGALANVEQVDGPTIIPVNLIEEAEQFSTTSPTSTSYGYFFKGNYVQILPTPNIGTVRLWYFKRTSNLVLTTAASQCTVINSLVVSTSLVPSTIVVGSTVDLCGDQPPFNIFGTQTVTAVAGNNITLDAVPTTFGVGDWVALSGQTPVPQVPVEFRLPLVYRTICQMYQTQGYLDKLKEAEKKLEMIEKATANMIATRVKSQTKIINPSNGGFWSGRSRNSNFPAGRIP